MLIQYQCFLYILRHLRAVSNLLTIEPMFWCSSDPSKYQHLNEFQLLNHRREYEGMESCKCVELLLLPVAGIDRRSSVYCGRSHKNRYMSGSPGYVFDSSLLQCSNLLIDSSSDLPPPPGRWLLALSGHRVSHPQWKASAPGRPAWTVLPGWLCWHLPLSGPLKFSSFIYFVRNQRY